MTNGAPNLRAGAMSPPANVSRGSGAGSRAAELLRGVREEIYSSGHVETETGKYIPVWPTGLTRDAGEFLFELALRNGAARTIETGFALGLSSLFLVEAALECASDEPGPAPVHTAIDPFQTRDWGNAGLRSLARAGVADRVRLFEADSALVLPNLIEHGERFDVGFVDGGHWFDNAFVDILFMLRLVRPGGIIVVDDSPLPAIAACVRYFEANMGVPVEQHPGQPRRFAVLRVPRSPRTREWNDFIEFR